MGTPGTSPGPRIFISYSSDELDFVLWLSGALRRLGHEVWTGHEDIVAGQSTVHAHQSALDRADVMLLVITPGALRSRLVDSQWTYFYCEREKPVIPLVRQPLGPTDTLNFMLASLQSIDFSNEYDRRDDGSAALERLHHTLLEAYSSLPVGNGELSGSFLTPLNPEPEPGMPEVGIRQMHPAMPTDTFFGWVEHANRNVQIMSTWTGLLAQRPQLYLEALERGCMIQVLLLNPSSPFARQRSRDLKLGATAGILDEQEVPRNIQATIRELADLFLATDGYAGELELRLFDMLPPFSLHRCDTHTLIGFYPHSTRTTAFPMLEVRTHSAFGRHFTDEFDAIWSNALVVDLVPRYPPHRADDDLQFDAPSARELEVLALIEAGLSNQDIAERLVVSLATVKKHINNLYSKLGVKSRTQAILRAHQHHLI